MWSSYNQHAYTTVLRSKPWLLNWSKYLNFISQIPINDIVFFFFDTMIFCTSATFKNEKRFVTIDLIVNDVNYKSSLSKISFTLSNFQLYLCRMFEIIAMTLLITVLNRSWIYITEVAKAISFIAIK